LIPAFERLLELEHEFAAVGAVDEAMIEAEAELLHRPDRNRIAAFGVSRVGVNPAWPHRRLFARLPRISPGSEWPFQNSLEPQDHWERTPQKRGKNYGKRKRVSLSVFCRHVSLVVDYLASLGPGQLQNPSIGK
jgi:hypothetical protein